MRPSELGLWVAVHAVDPWDEERADLRAGIVASTVVNWAGKSTARGSQAKPSDFMPYVTKKAAEGLAGLKNFLKSRPTKKAN